ncbi:MAG TPA: DUF3574 domain-containing protein [Dyella sp.]|uniref:DUF3574 domain-containing protein n=1 Tax=Dyella sp. TaxID=1869338 RepID=UPI002D772D97|nr:DUF3574 domain-containing protein [Dyella sp.]HET6553369.1 DUF3574 domain-containing protein [Dyella sp.]
MHHHRCAILLLSVSLLAGCVATGAATHAVPPAETSHRAQGWVETRLYFGLGPADDASRGVGDAAWRSFLDSEVTPRFPDGFTVLDAYGQWQGKGQASPERLRSRVLVIAHADTAGERDKVEAIRAAWKRRTGDQSVLRVTQAAEVSF